MTQLCQGMPSVLYENRYWNQNDFNIVVFGGNIEVFELKDPNFKTSAKLRPFLTPKYFYRTAVMGFIIYVVGRQTLGRNWNLRPLMLL